MDEQSGEKTEEATPHRLRKAREEGNVSKSQDVNVAVTIVTLVGVLLAMGSDLVRRMAGLQGSLLSHVRTGEWSVDMAHELLVQVLGDALVLLGPLMLALVVAAVAVNLAQTGPVFSTKPLGLDLTRLNPATGLKRLFSIKALFDSAKGVVKLVLLLWALYLCVKNSLPALLHLGELPAQSYLGLLIKEVGRLLVRLTFILVVLAAVDLAFTRWKYGRDMRMSKYDIKQEHKSREGDPRIRSRLRQMRRQVLKRSRSMAKVPKADVVITNPTHFAVAISYEHGVSLAPQVVAKGAGENGRQIREIAGRHQIPVVQNPPLARALYREVDFDKYVPERWFPQVAKILIWVYAMRQARARTNEE